MHTKNQIPQLHNAAIRSENILTKGEKSNLQNQFVSADHYIFHKKKVSNKLLNKSSK